MATVRLQSATSFQAAVRHDVDVNVDVDMVLRDSFPASDPPSWTAGIAEAGSAAVTSANAEPLTGLKGRPEWLRTVGSVIGTTIVVLAFPVFVVGLPFALGWRLVQEVAGW